MARGKKRGVIGRAAKQIAGSKAFAVFVGFVASLYVRIAYYTTRWRWIGREHLAQANADPRSYIGAVWHGRLAPIAMLRPRGRRAVALASAARDGEMIAQTMRFLRAETVRGSSRDPKKPDRDRGGSAAVAPLIAELRAKAIVVITPDGPRGPIMRVKPGVAVISASAEAPVLPVAYAVRRAKLFNSWDRFMLPWPFNRGVFVFGPLIEPAPAHDPAAIEARRQEIEAALYETTRRADEAIGRLTPPQGEPLDLSDARPELENAAP
ncbi:MAG: lysophospholipid acyltransferase family protein [Neomegalonema sp.]|nr:lysophospholipid acyltransferase family protein [Neomegalonema sp.]